MSKGCSPTGGIAVDHLPGFPKRRWPVDKKWYWGWKKLLGEAATPPECPYSHPWEDLRAHFQAQSSNSLTLGLLDKVSLCENGTPSLSSFMASTPISKLPDQQSVDYAKLVGIMEGIAGLLPERSNPEASDYPNIGMSPSTLLQDLNFEI
ncbi:hypothetical protein F5Y19DRAFT_417414 [Xylariaceae sp. FL1651]|nr:hypothetical protein F5Y19DRAFT_417414 [Xylariaceae sp. FL1651]